MEGVMAYIFGKTPRPVGHGAALRQNEWRESSTSAINHAQKREHLIAVPSTH